MQEHISSMERKRLKLRTTLREQNFRWWNVTFFVFDRLTELFDRLIE